MSREANRRLVERYYTAAQNGDRATLLELHADDVVINRVGRTPISGRTQGRERNFTVNMAKVFTALVPEESHLAVRWRIFAVDDDCVAGSMLSQALARNGKRYDQTHIQLFTIRDGKIAEIHEAFDTALVESALFENELQRPETPIDNPYDI
jgi:ketosteroid isomerase-like protein